MKPKDSSSSTPNDAARDFDGVLEAMCAAVAAAVLEHKRMGESIVIWRNGRIEWVEPDRIPDDGDLSKLN